ncbi:universal stress protein [Halocatena pleomorpha]|uniref:Universal stress protein n=1 Tax=Halocatena pleomorpha TaxID=1785090 RepID=A0A3P3R6S9_9EURY|nr:universal stress protein [Halocatena pleomorpha]RRJ28708.1 universal stress protein [Halocatena pleomorpha]
MYDTILIPTDGSDAANAAAKHAIAIAIRFDATLHVLSVIDTRSVGITTPTELDVEQLRAAYRTENEAAIEKVVEKATNANQPTTTVIQLGVPDRTITDYVTEHDIDLVVMGTHGRTGVTRALLGSVAEQVLRTSSAPVLTVHSDQDLPDDR